jgi:hypothetical protein
MTEDNHKFSLQPWLPDNMVFETNIKIKPYTHKQLCMIFEVSDKVMREWVKAHAKDIGKRRGHFFTALQVFIIFSRLGPPGYIKEKKD